MVNIWLLLRKSDMRKRGGDGEKEKQERKKDIKRGKKRKNTHTHTGWLLHHVEPNK